MKELDELLTRFARDRYPAVSAGQQAAFEALLALPDPQIADYLLGHDTPPEADLETVIRAVLAQ
jgi:succinate dehydrogenase flavin-adding protein (antitoxin of CptAB toxin-antitoxin module)